MKRTGRKLLSLLLTLFLVMAVIPTPAGLAAGTVELKVTPSVATANVGDEVTFTITMGSAAGTDLERFDFKLLIPDGLTYVRSSGSLPRSFINSILEYLDSAGVRSPNWMATFDDEYGSGVPRPQNDLLFSGFGDPYNGNNELVMATFKCTVDAPGNHVVSLKDLNFAGNNSVITTPVTPATVNVTSVINSMDLALVAPVLNGTPQTTVSGAGYTGTVSWSGNPVAFTQETVYTATVTLTANDYYTFGSALVPTVSGSTDVRVTSGTGTGLALNVAFPATPSKTDVGGSVTFNSSSLPYNGSQRSLTATSTDTTGGSFSYHYSGANGTVYDSAGAPVNAGVYNVIATYESDTVIGTKAAVLTVTPLVLTVSGVSAVNREYNGANTVELAGGSLAGVIAGDQVDVSLNLGNGTIADANAGGNKPVTTSITLAGAKRVNYTLDQQPTNLTVNIFPADFSYDAAGALEVGQGVGLQAITAAPATGTGIGGTKVNGAVAWFSDAGRTTAAIDSDLSSLSANAVKTLYWRFTPGDGNYIVKEGSTVFTVSDNDPQPMTFAATEVRKGYGDGVFTNAASHTGGSTGKGEIAYFSGNTAVATVNQATGEVTITGVGTAEITATAAAVPAVWAETSITYTLIVGKKNPVAGNLTFNLPATVPYDGTTHGVYVTVNAGLPGIGAITAIKYNNNTSAPVNAGTYAVTVDLSEGANFSGITALSLGDLTISPKTLTAGMLNITGVYTYNGSVQSPAFTVTDGGSAINPEDYSVTSPSQTDAGNYQLTITGKRNYGGTATQSFVIGKLTPVADNLTIAIPTATDYDGYSRKATVTAGAGKTGLGTVKLYYNGNAAEPVMPGSYTVTADITEGTNYAQVTGLTIGTIVINKKAVSGISRETTVKPGLAKTYDFDLTTMLPPGVTAAQISSYSYKSASGDNILVGSPALNGTTLTIAVSNAARASEQAKLTIGFTSDYYTVSDAVLTVKVTSADTAVISGVTVTSRAYNGNAITYDASGIKFTNTDTGAVISGLKPVYTWSGGAAPVDAGHYSLTVSADGADYAVTPQVINFNITKAMITLKADNKIIALKSSLPSLTFTAFGLVAPNTWQDIRTTDPILDCGVSNTDTAGSYTITISGGVLNNAAGKNYQISQYSNGVIVVGSGSTNSGNNNNSNSNNGNTTTTDNLASKYASLDIFNAATPLNASIPGYVAPPAYTPNAPGNAIGAIGNTFNNALNNAFSYTFSDVLESDWFRNDVEFVSSRGIMQGTGDETFNPGVNMTRGMIVTVLYRSNVKSGANANGMSPFIDVPSGMWYSEAIAWAAANRIVTGYGNGRFGPDDVVTRQDLAVIFYRYARFTNPGLAVVRQYQGFADDNNISNYAKEAVEAFYTTGIISGKPGNMFDPHGKATRAEGASMLSKFIQSSR